MKKLITIIAAAVTGLIAFPNEAEAGHASVSFTYQSGRSSCGCPIYTKRYFNGYDCHRRPVYRYVHVPVAHRCSAHARPHHRGHSYYNHSRYSHHGYRSGYSHSGYRSGYSRHGSSRSGYRPGCR